MRQKHGWIAASWLLAGCVLCCVLGSGTAQTNIMLSKSNNIPSPSAQSVQTISAYPTNPASPLALMGGLVIKSETGMDSGDVNWTDGVSKPTLYFSLNIVANIKYCLYMDFNVPYNYSITIKDSGNGEHMFTLYPGNEFLVIRSPETFIYPMKMVLNVPLGTSGFGPFIIDELFLDQLPEIPINDSISTNWGVAGDIQMGLVKMTLHTGIAQDTTPYYAISEWRQIFGGLQLLFSGGLPTMVDFQRNQNMKIITYNNDQALTLEMQKKVYTSSGVYDYSLGVEAEYVVFSKGNAFTISQKEIKKDEVVTPEEESSINGFTPLFLIGVCLLAVLMKMRKR